MQDYPQVTRYILKDIFEVDTASNQNTSGDILYHQLVDHIAYLLDHNRDFLMSLLYRLDVRERSIKEFNSDIPLSPAEVIAQLIIARQVERIKTKESFNVKRNIDPDIESW